MKVLAILQNQWFKDPAGAERIYAEHEGDLDRRARLNAAYLFFGCLTGRRLLAAFGEERRHSIVWEEASPRKAGQSDGAFPPDAQHIRRCILHHRPNVVMGFGQVARQGVIQVMQILTPDDGHQKFAILYGPHPAARHATVMNELRAMAGRLNELEGVAA